ncbi:MAG TPA: hypothetical protein VGN81_41305 [Pseudonocardiaceae bacterium]|jgi:hypothetical protein
MNVYKRAALLVVFAVLFSCAAIGSAAADTPSSGGDVQVAQTLGGRELTLILRRVTAVPGPLHVDVITHAGDAPGTLSLAVSGAGTASRGSVTLGAKPGSYGATVQVDRAGPWELAVGDGQRTAHIPFVVTAQATSPPDYAVYSGFLGAGVLLIVSVLVAVRARNGRWALVPMGGVIAGLSVAITGAILSASLPLPPQPGIQLDPTTANATDPYAISQPLIADYSRPPVMLSIPGSAPVAGRTSNLTFDLSDGATGLPVDDLVVHDSALIHLLIVGPSGQLWHLHPVRVAPGEFQVQLTLPQVGHYAVSAELERRGGGVQFVRSPAGIDLTSGVEGPSAPAPLSLVSGQATHNADASVTATIARSGAATTMMATFGNTADLQPWLGMLGHLIIAGPLPDQATDIGAAVQQAPVWAHAHSMGDLMPASDMAGMPGMAGMTDMSGMGGLMPVNGDSAVDETVAAYGPDISFTFTFPEPGRYRIWIQAERNFTVLTVPAILDVPA